MPSIVLRPEAVDDVRQAQRWYEERSHGLGEAFVDAVDETLARLAARPLAYPEVHGAMRRAVMHRFPYGIYFRVIPDGVVVLAVMHGRRHPLRWQARQ